MRKALKLLLFLPVFGLSQITDSVNFKKVLHQLDLQEKKLNLALATDKILPFEKEKTIFVLPKYRTKNDADGWYKYDFYLVKIDNKSGKILNKYEEENAWTSDAEQLTSVEIDTGLFFVNEKIRAIGIRRNYSGTSNLYPYHEVYLSLFIPENESFRTILKNLSVDRTTGFWDGKCRGEFEERKSFFDFSGNKTNNFSDIILKTTPENM